MSKDDYDLDPVSYYEMFEMDSADLAFPEPGENPEFDEVVGLLKRLAEILRRDKIRIIDKQLASMKKAEIIEFAHDMVIENQMLWLELGKRGEGNLLSQAVNDSRIVVNKLEGDLSKAKAKARLGSDKTNQGIKEFWDKWRVEYKALRNEGHRIMDARRLVNKMIMATGHKGYSIDRLKKQLKD